MGLLVAGFIGSFQAHQPGQCRRLAGFQAQRRVGRVMPQELALMIVVITLQFERPEEALEGDLHAALALTTRFGLASGIAPIGQLLEQMPH